MAILFSNEIVKAIMDELKNAEESVQIITAYCKTSSFLKLNECINESVKEKQLLIRFRLDDVLKNSTDFNVLEEAMKRGWKVYIRFDIHAKTYIVDNKRGFIGSANITNSGLNIIKNGNMEMATLVDIESEDVNKIEKLFLDAISVDDSIVTLLKRQYEAIDKTAIKSSCSWDKAILMMFKPRIDTLFSHELPEEYSFADGEYISFLDETFSGNIEDIKEQFRWSNAYLWLLRILNENEGCMYFGAITEKLHEALITDPKPYRRDVKNMLSNLLKMIERLGMEEVVIDRPNHSQRVRLLTGNLVD